MKNTRKTVPFLLLSTMALGLIVAVTADRAPEADPLLEDEIVTTEDGGQAIAFGNHVKKANEVDTAHPVLGIDVTDVGENKAIRFVAAIDGYQGLSKATWTRSVKEADAVIKEEASFDLKYVYTELPRAADVQWTTPLEEGKTYYYMTYTLNNIPEANWWSEIDVSLKTYDLAGGLVDSLDDRANVWGVLGDPTVGSVTYTKYEDEGDTYYGDYYFYGGGTGDIVVAPFVWSLVPEEDHLAESLGKVVTAGDLGSTNGCFENKKGLGNVTLPDTIVEFNRWAFAGTEIAGTVNFPSSLQTIGSSCFNSGTSLHRIVFETSQLTSIQSTIQTEVAEFVVPMSVTTLPTSALFSQDGLIGQITYEGTEAEWAALTAAAPGNHIVSDWTICSDTEVATVTFDLNGGTAVVDGAETNENVVMDVIVGRTVPNVPKPRKDGYFMAGWVLDLENPEPLDMATYTVDADVTLHAYWTAFPVGNSLEDPYIIEGDTFSGVATTVPGMEVYYLKFTAQADDRYYISLGEPYDIDEESTTAYTRDEPYLFLYGEDKTELTTVNSATYEVDHLVPHRKSSYSTIWTLDLLEGETVYLGVTGYYSSYNPDDVLYGKIPVEITTAENDTADEAVALDYETKTRINWNGTKEAYAVYKIMPNTIPELPTAITIGGEDGVYTSVTIYDEAGEEVADFSASSATTEAVQLFEDLDLAGTYYLVFSSNFYDNEFEEYVAGETSSYVTIGVPPDGLLMTSPEVNEALSLTMGEPITVSTFYEGSHFYEITVEETALYRLILDGGTEYYAKQIIVYDAEGNELGSVVEEGEEDWWDVYYGTEVELDLRLEPGTYTIEVGYTGGTSTSSFTFLMAEGVPGFTPAFASDVAIADGTITVPPVEGQTVSYARFTAETSMDTKLTASDPDAALTLYDGLGQTELVTGTGVVKYVLEAGTDYVIAVDSETGADVVLTLEQNIGIFSTDYAWAQGTYIGTLAGSSYYKFGVGSDEFSWEGKTVDAVPVINSYDEARGILNFTAGIYDVTVDQNGNALVMREGTERPYYLSKYQSVYNSGDIDAQYAKTTDWAVGTGVALISVMTDIGPNPGRVYGAIVEGEFLPTVELEFVEGTSLEVEGTVMEVTAYGTVIGTATVTGYQTITWVAA